MTCLPLISFRRQCWGRWLPERQPAAFGKAFMTISSKHRTRLPTSTPHPQHSVSFDISHISNRARLCGVPRAPIAQKLG
jgi:hypothetical protein